MASRATANDQRRRGSIFFEIGLGGDDTIVDDRIRTQALQMPQSWPKVSMSEKEDILPTSQKDQMPKPRTYTLLSQLLLVGVVIALVWPGLYYRSPLISFNPPGADASPMPAPVQQQSTSDLDKRLETRADSPTDVCKRWAHMSAIVNGTLYVYGGQAMTSADQTTNTWNNNFLTLDLTKNWQIGTPSLTGLPQPSGPPAVALGTLWNDLNNLYLYGGEFSWQPVQLPTAFSLWQYSIKSNTWIQHSNPQDTQGQSVQRSAEGAGVSIPGMGRGYYLGGHLDGYTTQGWSQSIPRLYLESTLEFTMPGSVNSALSSSSPVGTDGVYRNISADSAGFPRRADGVLVYIPGYGDSGIIIGVGGGTSGSFTQMNIIDVYDIATSKWYKQATSGPTPNTRVNPCAVAASAADGSSTQVYMYGGQNLQPAGNQTQYDDMWILTVPSFTWIQVDQSGQSTPPARAGHSCNIWNSQMVVVGGYVGAELSCDSPGVYVFNTSSLTWQTQYNALAVSDPLNRQTSQNKDLLALEGSYGYQVPSVVRNAIGGNAAGAATVTQPAQTATQGPLQSGKPKTYTITGANGAVTTQTSTPGSNSGSSSGNNDGSSASNNNGSGTNIGAIVAGVIAGLLAILALYLGFCVWVYRKQLKLYKHHVAMAQSERLSHDSNHPAMTTIGSTYVFSEGHRSPELQRISGESRSGHSGGAITASSNTARRNDLNSNNPYRKVAGGQGYATAASSTEDLAIGQEPSFIGVMLNPRRSLRVMNRD